MIFLRRLFNTFTYFLSLGQIAAATGQHSFLQEQSQIIGEKTKLYVNLMEYF
jgi:hypothetical protein